MNMKCANGTKKCGGRVDEYDVALGDGKGEAKKWSVALCENCVRELMGTGSARSCGTGPIPMNFKVAVGENDLEAAIKILREKGVAE